VRGGCLDDYLQTKEIESDYAGMLGIFGGFTTGIDEFFNIGGSSNRRLSYNLGVYGIFFWIFNLGI